VAFWSPVPSFSPTCYSPIPLPISLLVFLPEWITFFGLSRTFTLPLRSSFVLRSGASGEAEKRVGSKKDEWMSSPATLVAFGNVEERMRSCDKGGEGEGKETKRGRREMDGVSLHFGSV
jgi:hypothetical protein